MSSFMCEPEDDYVHEKIDEQMEDTTRKDIEDMVLEYYPGYSSFLEKMDDDTLFDYVRQMMAEQIKEQYGIQMGSSTRELSDEELAEDFGLLDSWRTTTISGCMKTPCRRSTPRARSRPISKSSAMWTSRARARSTSTPPPSRTRTPSPTPSSAYNDSVAEDDQISYTDIVALLMSSITTIINVISYVLIAFVAISLVVSSIMIGIITYISVLERTKEIGILRAIGASKRDVSRVFNAETFIIGLFRRGHRHRADAAAEHPDQHHRPRPDRHPVAQLHAPAARRRRPRRRERGADLYRGSDPLGTRREKGPRRGAADRIKSCKGTVANTRKPWLHRRGGPCPSRGLRPRLFFAPPRRDGVPASRLFAALLPFPAGGRGGRPFDGPTASSSRRGGPCALLSKLR